MNVFKRLSLRLHKGGGDGITGLVAILISGIFLAVIAVIYSSVIQGAIANVTGTAGTFAGMAGWALWIAAFVMILAPAVAIIYKAVT
jgi:hypothetical protein